MLLFYRALKSVASIPAEFPSSSPRAWGFLAPAPPRGRMGGVLCPQSRAAPAIAGDAERSALLLEETHLAFKCMKYGDWAHRCVVGPHEDEMCMDQFAQRLVVYFGGTDSLAEWGSNAALLRSERDVDAASDDAFACFLERMLARVCLWPRLLVVGFSRGAAIAVRFGETVSEQLRAPHSLRIVTVGDPGLVLARSGDLQITSVCNDGDAIYGLVREPSGAQVRVRLAPTQWCGDAVCGHGRYPRYTPEAVEPYELSAGARSSDRAS